MEKDELIGKIIRRKDCSHARGKIISIEGNKMKVEMRGENLTFPYPDAFTNIFELADLCIQEEIKKESNEASFESFKNQYVNAVRKEIQYLRETGGKKYRAIDGERLETKDNSYVYAFDMDSELHFPDGTMIKIKTDFGTILGNVITCEEFTIIFKANNSLGKELNTIEFTAEPWQLLEALVDRIIEMTPSENSIAYQLACEGRSHINQQQGIVFGQNQALIHAEQNLITFIWGPPGTGKTETLARIAMENIEAGKRVLMLSYSNVSVDGALLRVAKKCPSPEGVVVRYGYPRVKELLDSNTLTSYQYVLHSHPELALEYKSLQEQKKKTKSKSAERIEINKRLTKIRETLLEQEKNLIQNAAFVATTVSKAIVDKSLYSQHFDTVIFDEASMAYIPQIIYAAGMAKAHFCCLGDFRQLPAIVQCKENTALVRDIFDHTGITEAVENECGHDWLIMLNIQHRMHPEIAEFVGKHMYSSMLLSADNLFERRQIIADIGPNKGEPMGMIDLSYMYSSCVQTMDMSRINVMSAFICARIAEQCADKYEVGIITPYSAQSRLLLAMVRDMEEKNPQYAKISCATVHQFQGSEKPVIIYDAVDCFRMPYPGMLLTEVKNDTANRLFNVALTRAQGKFILVANRDFMERKRISKKLIFTKGMMQIEMQEAVQEGDDVIEELQENNAFMPLVQVENRDDNVDNYVEDLLNAEKSVFIDIPGMIDENEEAISKISKAFNELSEKGVVISIRTEGKITLPEEWMMYVHVYSYLAMPITIIDKKIVWYGEPITSADFETEGDILPTEYFPSIRFEGNHTARILQAFLGV